MREGKREAPKPDAVVTEDVSVTPEVDVTAPAPEVVPVVSPSAPEVPQAVVSTQPRETSSSHEAGAQSARAPPVEVLAAIDTSEPPAAQVSVPRALSPIESLLADIVRHLQYTFANIAPTMAPHQAVYTATGTLVGNLHGQSNNGFKLTYTVTQAPRYGEVLIDQATGQYTYIPDPFHFNPGFIDTFTITANNGTAARLPGLLGVVQDVVHSVAQRLGFAQRDTESVVVNVSLVRPGAAGDPTNAQYWAQQHYEDCALMAVAMISGQLNGVLPTDQTEQDIIDEASRTPSVVRPGEMMWYSSTQHGISPLDAVQLLRNHGFNTTWRTFGTVGQPISYANGQAALDKLTADLAAGHGVFVAVNARTIWTAVDPVDWGGKPDIMNHAVVVLAVDTERGLVYLNDSGVPFGQGMVVPLGAFMWAWGTSSFFSATAEKPVAAEQEVEEALLIAA